MLTSCEASASKQAWPERAMSAQAMPGQEAPTFGRGASPGARVDLVSFLLWQSLVVLLGPFYH